MSNTKRVVLLACGSFNPITNMHLRMFELARDSLHRTERYRVIGGIISPVNDNYGKKDLVSAKHRCAMVNAAIKSSDWIRLDKWETEQDSWVETARTLAHHRSQLDSIYNANTDLPNKRRKVDSNISADECDYSIPTSYNLNEASSIQLKLLCGADLLESFAVPGLWKDEDIEAIVSRYGIVCISRNGSDPYKFIYESDVLTKYQNNIHIVREWITNDVSSTKIRRALKRGESVKYLVQDAVIDYIRQANLYSANDNKYLNYITPSPNREDPPDNYPLPDVQFLSPYDTGYSSASDNLSNAPSPETNNLNNIPYNDNITNVNRNHNQAQLQAPNVTNHHDNFQNHDNSSGEDLVEQAYYGIPSSPKNFHHSQMPASPKNLRNSQRSPYRHSNDPHFRHSNDTSPYRHGNTVSPKHYPDNDTPPNSPRKPVTCMGADISGLVRRVKTMRVAMTSETCV